MFFFNDTATTEIYTLSLHDALPIFRSGDRTASAVDQPNVKQKASAPDSRNSISNSRSAMGFGWRISWYSRCSLSVPLPPSDRKSTRLNSSHANISYAVFCLKKNIKL